MSPRTQPVALSFFRRCAGILLLAASITACQGHPGSSPSAGPSAAPSAALRSGMPGVARADVTVDGVTTTITGGSCGPTELPAEFGSGYVFSLNIGIRNFEAGGPDYLGMLLEIPGLDPDGIYESHFFEAVGTLVAAGEPIRLTRIAVVIADDGARAAMRSVTTDGHDVEISITCGPGYQPDLTAPPLSDPSPTPGPEQDFAFVRIVNAWGTRSGLSLTVQLRLSGDEAAPLFEAAPGVVSPFISLPKLSYADVAVGVTVVEKNAAPGSAGLGPGEIHRGDRVTLVVYGELSFGRVGMRVDPTWDAGVAYMGVPWPETTGDDAVIGVFQGPLGAVEDASVYVRLHAGGCLEDERGNLVRGFRGGTGATYVMVEAGKVQLDLGTRDGSVECGPIEANLGTLMLDLDPGTRTIVIPWFNAGQIELIQLEAGR